MAPTSIIASMAGRPEPGKAMTTTPTPAAPTEMSSVLTGGKPAWKRKNKSLLGG
jgi:hypothetical protein